ncbi:MAG TPA: hypothetical protein VGG11_16915 [Xanthobacteraceae bacterium]
MEPGAVVGLAAAALELVVGRAQVSDLVVVSAAAWGRVAVRAAAWGRVAVRAAVWDQVAVHAAVWDRAAGHAAVSDLVEVSAVPAVNPVSKVQLKKTRTANNPWVVLAKFRITAKSPRPGILF